MGKSAAGTDYILNDIPLDQIRNKNEVRVIKMLSRILTEYPNFVPNALDIEDIYALALNQLPPRYVQRATVILREPVTDEEVEQAVRKAINRVRSHPTG